MEKLSNDPLVNQCVDEALTLYEFINRQTSGKGKIELTFISVAENLFKTYITNADSFPEPIVTLLTDVYKKTLLLANEYLIKGLLDKTKINNLLTYESRINLVSEKRHEATKKTIIELSKYLTNNQ